MEGDGHRFATSAEEAEYWKKLAKSYKQSLDETRAELDEFQVSSRELEVELEAQLEQAESKIRELTAANERLQRETDSLKERLEQYQYKTTGQMSELEDELAQTAAVKEELAHYIRELEQHNDDLERAKRATVVSLEDFEARLNSAIERNAFLESELDEKENLAITVQRLKDEARDLRHELSVTKKVPKDEPDSQTKSTDKSKSDTVIPTDQDMDSNRLVEHTPPPTPTRVTSTGFGPAGSHTPITPSARISALNIVGDLLRKVGALESKLASFRNYVKDQPLNSSGKSGPSSPLNSPRAKRLHRGNTAPQSTSNGAPASSQQDYVKISV